jgi:hypothetical protein
VGDAGRVDGNFRVTLLWEATDYRVLFGRFDGTIEVRPRGGHTVLSVEGSFSGPVHPAGTDGGGVAARRAAESAMRSLLGHLRSAVEESAGSPR